MLNYIKADFYHIFSKKGMYLYFAICIGVMLFGLYIGSGSITTQNMGMVANLVFTLFGTFTSVYLFSTVYNDDLSAKTLSSVVGFGKKRGTIVISKLLINIVLTVLVFFIAFVGFCLLLTFIGFQLNGDSIRAIGEMATANALKGVGVSCLASVLVYGLQKATPAIVIFIMVTMGFFTPIISFILDKLELADLGKYLIDPIVNDLMKNVSIETVVPYVLYVMFFTVLAIVAFKQRDLDF